MTQSERRTYLIQYLLAEQPEYRDIKIPKSETEQKKMLRALFNVRMPVPASNDFLQVQDEYLQGELTQKGITDYRSLSAIEDGIYLWRGDITTLKCGAIVNAANSQMLGCFCPNHGCIDNAIHTFAGIQLRSACADIMNQQGHEEEIGKAKITPAFNLPSDYVIHTVGPIVHGVLSKKEKEQLADCYRSCLELAEKNNIHSIALCCISTGEFHFPNTKAAEIAVQMVQNYKAEHQSEIEVIFNVFKEIDYKIYQELLG